MKQLITFYFKKVCSFSVCLVVIGAFGAKTASAQSISPEKLASLKAEIIAEVDKQQKMTQEMLDMVFSFGELGFQEFETAKYLTGILSKNGFKIENGVAGIPTAWTASWGSGKPVIALGSDVDCIPKASQKPGVAYHDPIVEGAPGHGEGHNSGMPMSVTAVLALKKIMEREKLPGTVVLWPGIAEELLSGKAYYVRDGVFKDIDACIFSHVGSGLGTGYGPSGTTGLVSVKFNFQGEAAHAASPWRGKSALDAVEMMNKAWNYHREHMETSQRSHYVITDGGDQPNVVPSKASVWYYFREGSYPKIIEMYKDGIKMAQAAAKMTDTKVTWEVLGSAWPGHMNQPLAEAMYENIKAVGMPKWTEDDQTLAKAAQKEMNPGNPEALRGLSSTLGMLRRPAVQAAGGRGGSGGGGPSDDIGDVSWNVPTVSLGFPANIPGMQGHHWSSAIAMATPIAHKGVTAGAKVQALTLLDYMVKPEIVKNAWTYFNDVQTKDTKYISLLEKTDKPPVYINARTMDEYRPEMKKFYYDPTKFKTYMEQLGVKYPTVRNANTPAN